MTDYKILVPPAKPHRKALMASIAVVVVVVAGLGALVARSQVNHSAASIPARNQVSIRNKSLPSKTGAAKSGGSGSTSAQGRSLRVISTTPTSGATNVPSNQAVSIRLSSPISSGSAMPTWSPPVSGTWTPTGADTLTFVATEPFMLTTSETLTIPSGKGGIRSTTGGSLASPTTVQFTIAPGTTLRLQQLLGQLGYLPLSFTPTAPLSSTADAFTSQPGTFAWKWPNVPSSLSSLWVQGAPNVITEGAVMNFESQAGLPVENFASTGVWAAMLSDLATGKVNTAPYDYVFVSKVVPEAMTVFSNGVAVPQLTNVAVNTGVHGANTADGTYPVFEHVVASRMKGTNPNGTTYNDPNVPWASFFNGGDALHGFVRASYGFPQSNGCVEMPVATAAIVWPLTPIGTLVTVVGPTS